MEDQEIKEILNDLEEGPSYGFSQKTMRKIEHLEFKKPTLRTQSAKSNIAILIPLFLAGLMLGSILFLEPKFSGFDKIHIWLSTFQSLFIIDYFWLSSSILIVVGFWSWILWEKRLQKNA